MEKAYIAPSVKRGSKTYPNEYFQFLKDELGHYYDVLEKDNRPCLMQAGAILRNAFKADVFVLSFVENTAFHKLSTLQYFMARLGLKIMKLRGGKIVFIFHNIHPHKGENWKSRGLTRLQLTLADLVVSHSGEAAEYARRQLALLGKDPGKVLFRCHPFRTGLPVSEAAEKDTDVLIWGNILPYKGVPEFVGSDDIRNSGLRIRIVGRCKDGDLAKTIESHTGESISFENRMAGFEEIAELIARSRYVLFPYLKGSVSSSGVLIDTLIMGGTPVGPDTGAFKDLAEYGLCLTYNSETGLLHLLQSDSALDSGNVRKFARENSWSEFARFIHGNI